MRRWPGGISAFQRRRWESNPLEAALQAAAVPSGSSAKSCSVLASNRAWSSTFAGSRANPPHSEDVSSSSPRRGIEPRPAVSRTAMRSGTRDQVARPGIEPGLTASEAGVRSGTLTGRNVSIPTWRQTRTRALGEPRAIRYTIGTDLPEPTTGFAPASSGLQNRRLAFRPRRQAGVQGVEPRWAVLEAACPPADTLLFYGSRPRGPEPGVTITLPTGCSSRLR